MSHISNRAPAMAMGAEALESVGPAARAGKFVITLCSLPAPVAVTQPGSPEFNNYRFFFSRRRLNGVERFFLHMGYFSTEVEAQPWLERVRRKYPHAFASRVCDAQSANGNVRASSAAVDATAVIPTLSQAAAPSSVSLTDTQVLKILDRRGPVSDERIDEVAYDDTVGTGISMLRPDDTQTLRSLKEAVVRNEHVWFAVQLHWSPRPMDLAGMPLLPIFKLYTLYSAEGERDGRSGFCARLGFFSDAISARQLAHYVRAEFESVAVVPISSQERERAKSSVATALAQPVAQQPSRSPKPVPVPPAPQATRSTDAGPKTHARPGAATLDRTLQTLAESEFELDAESASTTGVRHLSVEVLRQASRPANRSRTRK